MVCVAILEPQQIGLTLVRTSQKRERKAERQRDRDIDREQSRKGGVMRSVFHFYWDSLIKTGYGENNLDIADDRLSQRMRRKQD